MQSLYPVDLPTIEQVLECSALTVLPDTPLLDAIAIADDRGRYVDVNAAACDLFGISREELLGSTIADFAEPGFDFTQVWQHFCQQGQMFGEFSLYRPDGTVRETEFAAVANFIPHRHLSILRDISERKQTEQILRNIAEGVCATSGETFFQSLVQYLASALQVDYALIAAPVNVSTPYMKTIAVFGNGTIIDNFEYNLANTPCHNAIAQKLCVYTNNVQQEFPQDTLNVDARTQELFKTLETSSKRGADLVKQILTFARGTSGKRILLQPGHLLKELVKVINQTFPKSIEIRTDISTNTLWMVKADPTQFEQVFMNLAVNARDAMPNGGILTITAENRIIDQTYAQMHLEAKQGGYIVVTISDTGTGIPPEILERIFDPFFTTKEVGKGTGLGLSTVLGIVNNHGGFVQVSSQVGKGTQFHVFLPIASGTATEATIETELPRGNGELILVVDDEAVVQQTTQETLEDYNYKTLVAKDGIEAIALYAEHQQKISAVLLDMLMPNMDGLTAIRTLRTINPNVKIIATSGLRANEQKAIAVGAKKFLSKPYTATDLLTTLSDAIGIRE